MVRFGSVGSLPKGRHLKSDIFIMHLAPLLAFLYLGRAFGEIRNL
jgi:hypothetical protein